MATLGPIGKTLRGFQLIEFADANGETCSLQQSSLADYEQPGTSAVWLGIGRYRMHLQVGQVEALVEHLQLWLDNGSFDNPELDPEARG